MNFLRSNPILLGILGLVAIIGVIAFFSYVDHKDQRHEGQLVNSGEVIERGHANEEVINHVQNANEARDTPTVNELNVVCGKYDRNCQNSK